MSFHLATLSSPLGALRALLRGEVVLALAFSDSWERVEASLARRLGDFEARPAPAPSLAAAVARYFDGDVLALQDLALDPGGTPFQRAVWCALQRVPAGRTVFYGALARRIGAPAAARAVGAACGANPIWLAIPCHRALGNDGQLAGYAGGVARKRWLLSHERALPRSEGYGEPASFSSAVARAQR